MSVNIGTGFNVTLPEKVEKLEEALFPLHRQIERQYRDLPWPEKMQKIVVMTLIAGGRGDIAAAAKAIAVMQKFCPTLTFDWVLRDRLDHLEYNPSSFLNCDDPSKVHIRYWKDQPFEKTAGDLLVTGPVRLKHNIDYLESGILRKISGPTFSFMEIGEDSSDPSFSGYLQARVKNAQESTEEELYQNLHDLLFVHQSNKDYGQLPMGITSGTGVFLDSGRKEVPLSRLYCCPSYLQQIQDAQLRKDLLEAMDVFDGQREPDYDKYSLNSGYAHLSTSWEKFINCVAIQEKNKNVVIVLNQHGINNHLSTQEFQDQIFTPGRLTFLKQKGYSTIVFKGEEQQRIVLQENPELGRSLTVIVRPSFSPNDMRRLQLASERLMATGDNSAIEAWCCKCKLYLYEDVKMLMGTKWRFLQQQVDFAETISPTLSRLLALFGNDQRLPPNEQKMAEIEELLNDPSLEEATLQFCDLLTTSDHSFNEVLEGALKRTAWHAFIPELSKIEANAIDENFRTGLVAYLRNPSTAEKTFPIQNLSELGQRVYETVQMYLN